MKEKRTVETILLTRGDEMGETVKGEGSKQSTREGRNARRRVCQTNDSIGQTQRSERAREEEREQSRPKKPDEVGRQQNGTHVYETAPVQTIVLYSSARIEKKTRVTIDENEEECR